MRADGVRESVYNKQWAYLPPLSFFSGRGIPHPHVGGVGVPSLYDTGWELMLRCGPGENAFPERERGGGEVDPHWIFFLRRGLLSIEKQYLEKNSACIHGGWSLERIGGRREKFIKGNSIGKAGNI